MSVLDDWLRRLKPSWFEAHPRARVLPVPPGLLMLGLGGISIPEFYESARAYHSTTQSVSALTWTDPSMNSERWDNAAQHDTGTNPQRMTFNKAGKYVLWFQDTWASNTAGIRAGQLRHNGDGGSGGTLIMSVGLDAISYASALSPVWFSTIWEVSAGDWVTHSVLQDVDGSSALTLNEVEYSALGPLPV